MDRIVLPLESNDMLLYPDPDQAPQEHPAVKLSPPVSPPVEKPKPESRQKMLWDETETNTTDDER